MIHLSFEKPNLTEATPNTKEAAKKRQDAINKDKLEFAAKGGKVVIL